MVWSSYCFCSANEFIFQVKEAFQSSESVKRAPISTMFENVFDKMEPHLQRQMKEMHDHVRHNHDNYPVSLHQDSSP
jgi:hypothetical protein